MSSTDASAANAADANTIAVDSAGANVATINAAAANVSLVPSSNDSTSTDNIEAENPDVSVLNHEEQNQEMKDLLVFDPIGTKKKKAWYWKHFEKVTAIKMEAKTLYPNGILPHGLREVEKLLQKVVCWACKICLVNEQVAVNQAVKMANTNGSNLYSHLQTSLSGHNLSDPKKNLDIKGGLDDFVAQFRVEKWAKTTTDLKKRSKLVIDNLHRIVADVINWKGLANRFCEDLDFRALCEYLVENAVYLQSADGVKKEIHVGRRRLKTLQSIGLKEMLSYLTVRINKTREYLRSIHGQDVPFVHVQVDHVDMKDFIDALGISVSFIDPTGPELELIRAGVGLVESDTHTADRASQQALRVLFSRLGITQNLILPVGVDTTTSALKTSRLISGLDDECEC